jgi:hypothetical protein
MITTLPGGARITFDRYLPDSKCQVCRQARPAAAFLRIWDVIEGRKVLSFGRVCQQCRPVERPFPMALRRMRVTNTYRDAQGRVVGWRQRTRAGTFGPSLPLAMMEFRRLADGVWRPQPKLNRRAAHADRNQAALPLRGKTTAAPKSHGYRFKQHQILDVPVTAQHMAAAVPGSPTHCMIALGLRDKFQAHGLDFPGRGDGVGVPSVKFTLGPEGARANERYTCMVLGEGIVAEKQFDERGPLQPFTCRLQVIARRRVRKLGTRASRGLPPKTVHQKRDRERVTCTAVRRYHQIKVPAAQGVHA